MPTTGRFSAAAGTKRETCLATIAPPARATVAPPTAAAPLIALSLIEPVRIDFRLAGMEVTGVVIIAIDGLKRRRKWRAMVVPFVLAVL